MTTPAPAETLRMREATRHARNSLVHAAALYAQHHRDAFHPITEAAPTVLEKLEDGKLHRVQVRIPSTDPARSVPPPAGDLEVQNTMRSCVAAVSGCLAALGDYHRPRIPGSQRLGPWTPSPTPLITWEPARPGPLPRVDVIDPALLVDAVRVAHGLLAVAETVDRDWQPAERRLIHRACRWARIALEVWDTPPATVSQKGPWGSAELRARAISSAKTVHGTYLTPPGGWPGPGDRCRTCGYGEIKAKGECDTCLRYRQRTGRPRITPPPRCRTCGYAEIKTDGECGACATHRRRTGQPRIHNNWQTA